MTDHPPDLQALARRYLDLWQEQLGSMARDPAVSEALARSFSLMTQGLADAVNPPQGPSATAASEQTGEGHADPEPTVAANANANANANAADASRAASAGRASGHAGPVDDDMAARVERLEQRVALLEAALGGLLSGAGRPKG
ncbi:hypothetical protein [Rhodospira trueperi]|uniref:hypothetical protein n=1 Tax=Rhodospira trueperi TaxID=69960 RepID=UPI001FDEE7CD|nr:hypothetical protein [Rhodospira trueperi]